MDKAKRHEFRAVIDGVDLSPELIERLDRAVQGAVLAELSRLDLSGKGLANSPLKNFGETKGIWARLLDREQLQRLDTPG